MAFEDIVYQVDIRGECAGYLGYFFCISQLDVNMKVKLKHKWVRAPCGVRYWQVKHMVVL